MTERFEGKAVIFCATQRSGSSMIADDFQNACGRLRSESEAFYNFALSPRAQKGVTWEATMNFMRDLRKDEAVFFDKVMYHYLPDISRLIDKDRHDGHCTPFADYFRGATWVHIRRANVFEQTISKYFAEVLDVWDTLAGVDANFNVMAEFRLDAAKEILESFLEEDRAWQRFFNRHGIKPIQIFYEDAVANFPGYLAPLLKQLNVEIPKDRELVHRMDKLGNARNVILADVLRDMLLRELIGTDLATRAIYRTPFN